MNTGDSSVENKFTDAINGGINNLKVIVPEIIHLICPLINVAYKRQQDVGINMLESQGTAYNRCWNSFLFVDGRTYNFHTEKYCAYTFIIVPLQDLKSD